MGGLLFTLGITHPSAFISSFLSSLSWIFIPLITLPPSVTSQFTWPHPIPFFGGPFFFAPRVSPCFGSFILPPFSQSLSTSWFLVRLSPSFSNFSFAILAISHPRSLPSYWLPTALIHSRYYTWPKVWPQQIALFHLTLWTQGTDQGTIDCSNRNYGPTKDHIC